MARKGKRRKRSSRRAGKQARTPKASPAQQAKVHTVMSEFKAGTLKSSSGHVVRDRQQAIAIALSEAGLSRPESKNLGRPKKKSSRRSRRRR